MKFERKGNDIIIDLEKGFKRQIELETDRSNCKLSYIHQAGSLQTLEETELKQIFDYTLNLAKGCIILNTTAKSVFDFIRKTYPVYYAHEVPIGYNGGYQYHVCFRNTIRPNTNCRAPKDTPNQETKEVLNTSHKSVETVPVVPVVTQPIIQQIKVDYVPPVRLRDKKGRFLAKPIYNAGLYNQLGKASKKAA